MDVILERCAGIDVAKDEVVACVRKPGVRGRGRHKETRTFLSFTADLEAMADWFTAEGVTEVVMGVLVRKLSPAAIFQIGKRSMTPWYSFWASAMALGE